MNTLPKHFCIAPFTQLTTHPTGSFSPCPYLGGTAWKDSGSIADKWTGPKLEKLREQFLNGERPSLCYRCWNEEDNGKASLRVRMFDPKNIKKISEWDLFRDTAVLKEFFQGMPTEQWKKGPMILSIKNGNVCNAKCRSCHPKDSSKWIQDANKLGEVTGKKKFYDIGIKESNWSDQQVEDLRVMARDLKRIELYGGESLYNKKVIALLNHIVDDGNSKHIDLYVNTNGSPDVVSRVPGITEFKHLEIGVSIDAIPEHFGYVRHPLDFWQVHDNLMKLKQRLVASGTPHKILSISTVSILNIFYLPELKARLDQMFDISTFWNLLIYPGHLSIVNLPREVKDIVIQKLQGEPEFQEFINVMNNSEGDSQHWKDFFSVTKMLDDVRKENFELTFPEFAKIIAPYRPVDQ